MGSIGFTNQRTRQEWSVGSSVSLDESGTSMAEGSPGFSSAGMVFIFDYNNTTSSWIQRGQTITAAKKAHDDRFGLSVSLSLDGNVVAVGNSRSHASGAFSGQVQIFQYDATRKKWKQVAQDMNGEGELDGFGLSVSLSGNATVIGIGAWAGMLMM